MSTPSRSFRFAAALTAASLCWAPTEARAWVYPEHRGIALLAVEGLDPARRDVFDRLWTEARVGVEARLCEVGADDAQGLAPPCIDWAAFSGIAGDHSCSAKDMLGTVLDSEWILRVADVSAQLGEDLERVTVEAPSELTEPTYTAGSVRRRLADERQRAQRINALRTADTRLQQADPEYATRAGSNGAHFLLSRPDVDTTLHDYAAFTVGEGSEVNAIGVYVWYHLRALEKAERLSRGDDPASVRASLARAMLADEAFALHFLEDVYAAGHVVGSWGGAAQRKGTHDRYNETGLEVQSWRSGNETAVLMGDAHMRPQDAALASEAVRRSLEQVLDVASGRSGAPPVPSRAAPATEADGFDVCVNDVMPPVPADGVSARELLPALAAVVEPTPVPGLGPGLGALPRFRTELGPFIGLAAAIEGRALDGGFVRGQSAGALGSLDVAVRAGLGLEGVMGDAGDGLAFVQVGLRADTASSQSLSNDAAVEAAGSISAAIPARTALSTRVRMPFCLIPGDLLLALPLAFLAPDTYTEMAVLAGNGGLIPWQSGWATSIGRFQLVAGRELGMSFFEVLGEDRLVVPRGALGSGENLLLDYRSISFDLPVLDYRMYRSFSSNQSSSLLLQLFTGLDVPGGVRVVRPAGTAAPDLETIWSVGLRLSFDWRYYF